MSWNELPLDSVRLNPEYLAEIRKSDKFFDQRAKTFQFAKTTFTTPLMLLMPLGKGTLDPNYHDYRWHPDKMPAWDNDQQIRKLTETEQGKEFNVGCLFHGNKLDLDVDSTNPTLHAALSLFLSYCPTQFQWGRASKPLSHIAFLLNDPFVRDDHMQAIKALTDAPGMRIEVRGGEPKSNFFTLMPGSIHSTGELVEWRDSLDPSKTATTINTTMMLWRLKMCVAAALVAERVTEGERNRYFMSLGGMLVRMYKHAEDSGDTTWALDHDTALEWYTEVRRLGGDDMADTSRATSFTATWEKFMQNPNLPIMGGAELAKMMGPDGIKIRNAVYKLLTTDNEYEALEQALERFVLVRHPKRGYVDLEAFTPTGPLPTIMNETEMGVEFTRFKVPFGSKVVPLPVFLKHSNQVQTAATLELRPSVADRLLKIELKEHERGYNHEKLHINTWCGFAFKPSEQPVGDGDVEPFLQLIRESIANGDKTRYEWVLAWFADMFQDPGTKPGTLLAITGPQGCGKTMLGELIGEIVGPAHYGKIGSIEDLTQEFNSRVHNKLFVQGDETGSTQRTALARNLKELVTGSKQDIVYKGLEAIQANNPARYYFTSNQSGDALRVEPGHERRYTILEASAKRVGDMEYWEKLARWWGAGIDDDKSNLRKVLRYLLDYKYDKAFIRRALNTEEKKLHQVSALPPEVRFLMTRIEDGYPVSERFHEHPHQAYSGEFAMQQGKPICPPVPNGIDRTEWPTLVAMEAIGRDFAEWSRMAGIRNANVSSLFTLLNEAAPGGRMSEHKVTATVNGHRSRPIVRGMPSSQQIVYALSAKYPSMRSEFQQRLEALRGDAAPVDTPKDEDREF